MKTGFASHFEHKDDSCTDMAEKKTLKKAQSTALDRIPKYLAWSTNQRGQFVGVPCFVKNTQQNKTLPIRKQISDLIWQKSVKSDSPKSADWFWLPGTSTDSYKMQIWGEKNI